MSNNTENLSETPVKLPVFATLFGCYSLLMDKFKQFVFLGTAFAVILMIIYIAGGQDALCVNNVYRQTHFCTNNVVVFVLVHLLTLFILCIFMRNWYQIVLQNKPITFQRLFIPQKADFKILGLIVCYFLTLAVAGFSVYLLYIRVPNPDWRIELGYFAVVSLGFLVPFLALKFVSYFAFAADNASLPSPMVLWHKTAGNTFLILSSVIVLMMIGLFLSQALLGSFMAGGDGISKFYVMLGSEYLSDMAVIFIAACFMNYCYLQKRFLFERNENGNSGN